MTTDIYTLGIAVDTTDVVDADKDLDNLARSADNASKEVQGLGNKSKSAGVNAKKMGVGAGSASPKVKGLGRNAGQAGIQIQQLVGQIQGGQSAFVALSQQSADLGIVMGAPLIGVIVSLGAVVAGTLIPQFIQSKKSAEDLLEEIEALSDGFVSLTENQKAYVASQIQIDIEKETKRYNSLAKEIAEIEKNLALADEGQLKFAGRRATGSALSSRLEEYNEDLVKLRAELDTSGQAIEEFQNRIDTLGTPDDDSNGAKASFWGTDESVQKAAFAIRYATWKQQAEQLAELQAATRQANFDAQVEFSEGMAAYEAEQLQARLSKEADIYAEYREMRTQADVQAAEKSASEKLRIAVLAEESKNSAIINSTIAFNSLMEARSKDLFEIGKYGSASMAAINAYEAASKAWAQGGIYGAVSAAAVGVAAYANVDKILNTEYGSTSASISASPIPIPSTTTNNETTQSVSNTFNIQGGNADDIGQTIASLFEDGSLSMKNGSIVSV